MKSKYKGRFKIGNVVVLVTWPRGFCRYSDGVEIGSIGVVTEYMSGSVPIVDFFDSQRREIYFMDVIGHAYWDKMLKKATKEEKEMFWLRMLRRS